jgi:predicted DNA-binding protein with PD1-like motif
MIAEISSLEGRISSNSFLLLVHTHLLKRKNVSICRGGHEDMPDKFAFDAPFIVVANVFVTFLQKESTMVMALVIKNMEVSTSIGLACSHEGL